MGTRASRPRDPTICIPVDIGDCIVYDTACIYTNTPIPTRVPVEAVLPSGTRLRVVRMNVGTSPWLFEVYNPRERYSYQYHALNGRHTATLDARYGH